MKEGLLVDGSRNWHYLSIFLNFMITIFVMNHLQLHIYLLRDSISSSPQWRVQPPLVLLKYIVYSLYGADIFCFLRLPAFVNFISFADIPNSCIMLANLIV